MHPKTDRKNPLSGIVAAALLLVSIAVLIWPAVLNRGPIFFYDTRGYLGGAIMAQKAVLGIDNEWSASSKKVSALLGTEDSDQGLKPARLEGKITAARSIYYGMFVYAGALLGSLWFSILAQAAIAALSIFLASRRLLNGNAAAAAFAVIATAAVSSLPFFTSYLMPDLFTGLEVVAIGCLFAFANQMKALEKWWWFAVLALCLAFHTSNIAIAAVLLVVGLLVWIFRAEWPSSRALIACFSALVIGVGSQAAFYAVVKHKFGYYPVRPPFLMARLIADGPGYEYLMATCPGNGFKVCNFLPALPLSADMFLWSRDINAGVYQIAAESQKAELVAEEPRFVRAVLRFDPLGEVRQAFFNFLGQAGQFGILEFRYFDDMKGMNMSNLPPAAQAEFSASQFYQDTFPLDPINTAILVCLALAVCYLLADVTASTLKTSQASETLQLARRFAMIILLGILTNAAVTGILAAPHDRYQARVIWLVPFLAIIFAIGAFTRMRPFSVAVRQAAA